MNVDEAISTLRADYDNDVTQVAKELAKNLSDGDYSDDDSFTEALEREVQGHADTSMPWSLYSLAFTSNRDAWKDVYGKVSELGTDTDDVVNGMAYWAFKQDVYEELSSNHNIEAGSAVTDRCDRCWSLKDSCDCCSRCEERSDNCDCCSRCEATSNDCTCCSECESLHEDCTYCSECGSHDCKCKKDDEEEEQETPKPKRKPVEQMTIQVLAKEEESIDNQQETASWYKRG